MISSQLMIKILLIIICLLLIFFIYLLPLQTKGLEVSFFNVGQGDATLIRTQEIKILIDGGPDKTILSKLGKKIPFYDKKIDLVVLTHPHADHVTGLVYVLKKYQVEKVLMTGVVHTTEGYLKFLELIKEKGIKAQIAQAGDEIMAGQELKLTVLYPDFSFQGQEADDLNDTSIVLRLDYQETRFLLTGDVSQEVEKRLIKRKNSALKSQVLKVAHQGSSTSSSQGFLELVSPQYAVISVGENRFGHPSLRVLKRLEKLGAKILRTDEVGDIRFISQGEKVELKH